MYKLFKHPWLIIAVIGLITVFFALQLPGVKLDNNNLRFVPADDPARIVSAHIDDTFGSSLFILVGLERKYGTIFDAEFLRILKEYVARIEEIDIIGDVNSIMTTDYISGSGDSILVESIVGDDFSGSREELEEIKRKILSWKLYDRALVSGDFTATQVLVPLDIPIEKGGSAEVIDSFMKVRDSAREMFDGVATVYVTGIPVISATINEAVNADLRLLIPLVILIVVAIVFIPFRRVTATALSLAAVLIAVIWSIGAMPLFGIKMSILSTVLPVILIAMGSSYGIHVVIHYIEDMGLKHGTMNDEDHRALVYHIFRKTGKPIFLAALTTFAGFLSFCFTRVVPIKEFGFFASFGIMVSFVITVTLIPAILIIRGPKPMKELWAAGGKGGQGPVREKIAIAFSGIVEKRWPVLCLLVLITALGIYGASKIIIDNVMVEYFKADTDIFKSDKFIREKFGGSKVVSVVVEADDSAAVLHPDNLGAMDRLSAYLETRVPEVGKTMGFTDLVKRINQVFNVDESPEGIRASVSAPAEEEGFGFAFETEEEGFGFEDDGDDFGFGSFSETEDAETAETEIPPQYSGPEEKSATLAEISELLEKAAFSGNSVNMSARDLVRSFNALTNHEGAAYYEVPEDPERYGKKTKEELAMLVSNYLVLLSGNISDYANKPIDPTAIKTTVQLRTIGQEDTDRGVAEIRNFAAANFPDNVKVTVGGSALVEGAVNSLVVQSQLISIIFSIIAMFLIVAISYRSVSAGIISIIPLSILILLNFAIMGYLRIKLNLATAMISSISIGVGIDYTIHFMDAFKREYLEYGGKGNFLRGAYYVSGSAIIVGALSVGLGFAVLCFSKFNMLAEFGFLVAMAMMISALSGLVVIPVLLSIFRPKFIYNPELNNPKSKGEKR
ncbi:MAG: MMPL family transporter [Treponema sp.]|jgi:predicted RND superfamily exporter protein|nr:MMPL family transporter [Treponema sp.]